ncbi:MAG: tripartite tricarboxylate transporter substrate binding protein [Deltaproteobacteria bacterium]|nr:tripartite tricarboxylate transporter substrate binding protein [Deltaproteobacteria bacterium]
MSVMNAKPDGYTLGALTTSTAFIAPFSGEAPFKDLSGFAIINNFGKFLYPIMVRGDAPWKTWREFIEWSRKNPRAAKLGLSGARAVHSVGSGMWQVEQREQVEFTYVPFKGGPEILSATLGGHITLSGSTPDASFISYLQEGKLRVLVYLGREKIRGYEDAPSTQELYGFSVANICGMMGPKGLPDYVLKRLDDAFVKAAKDPSFIDVMNRMLMPIVYMDRAEVNKYVDETVPITAKLVQALKAEDEKGKK